jgi:membrane protease YdiL (CAAX protease family)
LLDANCAHANIVVARALAVITGAHAGRAGEAGTAGAAGWLPWLWLTIVVVTPIGEETLLCGFLFRGWQRHINKM